LEEELIFKIVFLDGIIKLLDLFLILGYFVFQ